MKESVLQKAILDYCAVQKGVFAMRMNTGATKIGNRFIRYGLKGQSDVFAFVAPYGRAVFIECKSDYTKMTKKGGYRHHIGKQEETQEYFQECVEKVGCIYKLAYTLDDAIEAIEKAKLL